MAIIRNLVVKISADISSLTTGLNTASQALNNVSRTFSRVGSDLTSAITLPVAALGTAIVKTSTDFQQSIANAASVVGATGDELQRMTDIARQMGATTVFTASQAADALYYMAQAGYDVNQMAASIEATLNLAAATQYGLAETTDIVIASLNQFGLEASDAERVTNVFAAAISSSMASMDNLSNSLSYVGPVAHSLGYTIEDTVASLSLLYNAGYEGSKAGTTLRQAFVNLMNPTAAALAIFEELGLAYEDLNPATNEFADIVDRLGQSGMTTAQAMEVFGARGGPGMLALLSVGGDAIREMTSQITGTQKASEMAAVQLDTLSGQWKILKSQLQEVALQFGDVLIPMIRSFLSQAITPLIEKLMSLSDEQREQIIKIAAISAAVGPLLLVIGKVTGAISDIIRLIPLLISKGGLITAGIATVITALVKLYNTNEEAKTFMQNAWQSISSTAQNVFGAIKTAISDVTDSIENTIKTKGPQIVSALTPVFETVKGVFEEFFNSAKEGFSNFTQSLSPLGQKAKEVFGNLIAAVTDAYEILKPVIDVLVAVILSLGSVVSGVIEGILSALGPFLSAVLDFVNSVIEVLRSICSFLQGDMEGSLEHLKNAFNSLSSAIQNIVNGIQSFISSFVDAATSFFKKFSDTIVALLNECWQMTKNGLIALQNSITNIFNSIVTFLTQTWQNITSTIKTVWNNILSFFSDIWSKITDVFNSAKDRIQGVFNTISSAATTFTSAIKNFFSDMTDKLSSGVKKCCDSMQTCFSGAFSSIKTSASNIISKISDIGSNIASTFTSLVSKAYNWGANMISNIISGIKSMWGKLKSTMSEVGSTVSDYVGFHSPTKKGPGKDADKWMPNMINMFSSGIESGLPRIASSMSSLASSLNPQSPLRSMTGPGTSPFGDLLNGYLQSSAATTSSDTKADIVLQIDGQTFARLISPSLNLQYKRNGVILSEA